MEPRTLERPTLPRTEVRNGNDQQAALAKQAACSNQIVPGLGQVLERMLKYNGIEGRAELTHVGCCKRAFDHLEAPAAALYARACGRFEPCDVPPRATQHDPQIAPTGPNVEDATWTGRTERDERRPT